MPSKRAADHAFDALVRANEGGLLAYLQRRTSNGSDAADAFGELLLIAWKNRDAIPPHPVEARMWLFGVARNVLQNSRRSAARASEALQRLADTMRALVPEPDDETLALRMAIQELDPDDAELVRLVYWDGFRSHEAAAILGINPSTARSRLSRARERLRAALVVAPG